MIKLQVIGHLGKDASLNLVNGKNVINFTIAHSERYTSQGQQVERTTWVDCSYWTDKTAIVPYLKKGGQVFVEGAPDVRSYQKQDGTQGATLTLRVNNIQLLGAKPEGAPASGTAVVTPAATYGTPVNNSFAPAENNYTQAPVVNENNEVADDLPF